jgi:pentapeptide MXKDX repeat protein
MSVDELPVDEMSVDELPVDEMSEDELPVDKMSVDEMSVDELPVDKISEDELTVDEMSVDELPVDELPRRRDAIADSDATSSAECCSTRSISILILPFENFSERLSSTILAEAIFQNFSQLFSSREWRQFFQAHPQNPPPSKQTQIRTFVKKADEYQHS